MRLWNGALIALCGISLLGAHPDEGYVGCEKEAALLSSSWDFLCEESYGIKAGVALLYEYALLGGVDFAFTDTTSSGYPFLGTVYTQNPGCAVGVEATLAYLFKKQDHFLLEASFLYLQPSCTTSFEMEAPGALIPNTILGDVNGGSIRAAEALSESKVNLNVLDIVLRRPTRIGSCTHIDFYGGLRSAWIFDLQNNFFSGGNILQGVTISEYRRSRFFGMGPEIGIAPSFLLGAGFSMIADLSGSLMYGRNHSFENQKYSSSDALLWEGDRGILLPSLRAELGFGFEKKIDGDLELFMIKLLCDSQIFFSQNQMISVAGSPIPSFSYENGNLGLFGLKAEISLMF